ncbi:polysaccharide pyruvyl transferase family protein [Lacrimispora xylanisolvens]|uniref:polysaccharide pyruvyl transferase family protein n=1 Tax=Lacrimispora xylanisolvens TaxID=384636 RepID=UPI002402D9AC|nr:polysaccharide pyruvyl transferase family protein [Paenibacillaceae bacterium]
MKQRFLIYGHGGCYNHGGEALALCGIEVLRERYPDCYIIVSSHNPDQDREFHLPADEVVGRDEAYLSSEISSNYSIENNDKIYKSTIDRITPDTICIHLGGDNYCYSNWMRYANIHYRAIEKGAKSILWSCSVDPDKIDKDMLEALRTHHLITAREDVTYKALIERGIKQVVKVSDIAFRLAPSAVPFELDNYVSITFGPLAAKKEKVSGIALRCFQNLVDYILAETDLNIALVPHVICKTDSDIEMMSQINTYNSPRIRLISERYSASQLKHIIGGARFSVTLRTHASIAAYSSYVPTLVIGYSVKSKGIAKDLDLSEYVLPVKELRRDSDIVNAFKKLVDDENVIKNKLLQNIPQYVKNSITEESFDFNS